MKYRVEILELYCYDFEIEADSDEEAHDKADEEADKHDADYVYTESFIVTPVTGTVGKKDWEAHWNAGEGGT